MQNGYKNRYPRLAIRFSGTPLHYVYYITLLHIKRIEYTFRFISQVCVAIIIYWRRTATRFNYGAELWDKNKACVNTSYVINNGPAVVHRRVVVAVLNLCAQQYTQSTSVICLPRHCNHLACQNTFLQLIAFKKQQYFWNVRIYTSIGIRVIIVSRDVFSTYRMRIILSLVSNDV